MFCPKCGGNNADGARFCKNCGHAFAPIPPNPVEFQTFTVPQPPKPTYAATQKGKLVVLLGIVTLALQSILNIWGISNILEAKNNLERVFGSRIDSSALNTDLSVLIFFFASSLLLTLPGMLKKSIGFLIPAAILGLISTMGGGAYSFDGLGLRWLLGLCSLGIYIVMIVLSVQHKKASIRK